MPCSDSSSSMVVRLDGEERFLSFEFAKITCGREISARTGYSDYCRGRGLEEVLALSFPQVCADLKIDDEEGRFIFYLEWDVLRCAIVEYLGGAEELGIDRDRCRISSVAHMADGIEIVLVVLPPRELPKILPCGLAPKENREDSP